MNNASWLLTRLGSRWTRGLAGGAIAGMIIWYLFPMVPALRPPLPRIASIVAVFAVILVVNGVLSLRRRRREGKLADGIAGQAGRDKGAKTEADAEVALLAERMRRALVRLRRHGRRRLYEQPWFVLIGPPGSGKTTALMNSGLHFPLAREDDGGPVGGVGGTRLCDWWFAEEALLIDTAGRYTTQDSDASVDRAGWHGFLDLLRRTRPRQPINGVIVVLPLADIAGAEAAERSAHARSVRLRIDEITERLKLRVPVYVVFSKADRLIGFDAYFDNLDASSRAQVWGMTFPLASGVEAFASEFRLLLARLGERLVERLQAERSAERRALIGGFPLQFASLEEPLAHFMTQAFSGSRVDPAPFLRGAYFTSATQDGTPIDRLVGMLARSFGIDQKRAALPRPGAGRSYFVSDLLRQVILGEAMLVSTAPRQARRRRIIRIAGLSMVGIATLVIGLALFWADRANRADIRRDDEALAAYRQRLADVTLDPVTSDDLPRISPVLDAAASLQGGDVEPGTWFLGLAQAGKLRQAGGLAYTQALQRILLPRLLWRLEQQMRGDLGSPDTLYQATRVYLMLGGAGPLDTALVQSWMTADWQALYPGVLNAELRADLLVHLGVLLAAPLPAVTLDGGLVERARATFSRLSPAARIYGRIRAGADASALPDWTPLAALGPTGARSFTSRSGQTGPGSVPGFLTSTGYDVLLHDLPATTHAVAGESWVLGHQSEIPGDGPAIASLETDVKALWVGDAETSWDALLGGLPLAPFGGGEQAVQDLYVLSSPQSPLRDLLVAVAHALMLPTDAKPTGLAVPLVGVADAAPTSPTPASGFELHYRPLLDLVGSGGAAALDNILRLINALDQELAAGSPGAASVPAALQSSGNPAAKLLAEADRQPAPVSQWLRQIAAVGSATLGSEANSAASAAFTADGGPSSLCRGVVDGHFPFDPAASADASIEDFARLFAPGGALDAYFQSQAQPYVDTRGAVWRPKAVSGVASPITAAAVASLQRAAAIRDAFFPAGSQPLISFTLQSEAGGKAALALGSVSVGTGASDAASLTWPGANDASLSLGAAAKPSLDATGPWALFRLLAKARLEPAGTPGRHRLVFSVADMQAAFTLQAGSVHDPFGAGLLTGFRCPVIR